MRNKYLARRDVLAWAGAMAAGGLLLRGALAQGAAAPLNFGYQTMTGARSSIPNSYKKR